MSKTYNKTCKFIYCKKAFSTTYSWQKYCSYLCKTKNDNLVAKKKRIKKLEKEKKELKKEIKEMKEKKIDFFPKKTIDDIVNTAELLGRKVSSSYDEKMKMYNYVFNPSIFKKVFKNV